MVSVFAKFSSGISDIEKKEIKQLILTEAFREPVPQVAIQMAVLIGSISRFDYPSDWIEVGHTQLHIQNDRVRASNQYSKIAFSADAALERGCKLHGHNAAAQGHFNTTTSGEGIGIEASAE